MRERISAHSVSTGSVAASVRSARKSAAKRCTRGALLDVTAVYSGASGAARRRPARSSGVKWNIGESIAPAMSTSRAGLSITRSRHSSGVTSPAVRGLSIASADAGMPRRASAASYWEKRARLRTRMQKSPHSHGRVPPLFSRTGKPSRTSAAMRPAMASRCLSVSAAVMSVSMKPGATALQRMFFPASSLATDLVRPMTPALKAA